MTEINLNRDQYLEFEKIAIGAFYPLAGFMDEEMFSRVVDTLRLPNGEPFPLPVVLDVSHEQADGLRGRAKATLIYDGQEVGEIVPESIYACDTKSVAQKVFGTTDSMHPGVRHFFRQGSTFVGGPVRLIRRAEGHMSPDEMTPAETKKLFADRGWSSVAGFQTRNVPHRAHEYLQRVALEHVDGLFIQPLVGRKMAGDYTPEAIMTGYRTLIDGFYRTQNVVLGILSTAMRYAGPREAVFHAIIRRNYGCTHFVVGRDHAGVGNYYAKYAAHDLVREFEGELNINVMRLHGPYHCRICDGIVTEQTCPHLDTHKDATTDISGTMIRAMLTEGLIPQPHIIRREIVDSLRGLRLFIDEDEK